MAQVTAAELTATVINQRFRLDRLLDASYGWLFAATELEGARAVSEAQVRLIFRGAPEFAVLTNYLPLILSLNGPGLVQIKAAGEVSRGVAAGAFYLATEPVETSLAQTRPENLSDAVRAVAQGLEHLHSRGLAHKRVTPSTVVRCGGEWKLAEAGLYSRLPGSLSRAWALDELQYAAPEVLLGDEGPPGDMWALGIMLLDALPFPASCRAELVASLLAATPNPPRLETPLNLIVQGCLMRDAQRRWAVEHVLAAISGEPIPPLEAPDLKPPVRPNARALKVSRRLTGHHDPVLAVADGVSGGVDRTVRTWDGEKLQWTGEGHEAPVSAVAMQNGKPISGSWDGTVRLWEGDHVLRIGRPVRAISMGNEGVYVLDDHGTLSLWAADHEKSRWEMPLLWSMTVDGDRMVLGFLDGRVWHGPALRPGDRIPTQIPRPFNAPVLAVCDEAAVAWDGNGIWWRGEDSVALAAPFGVWDVDARGDRLATAGQDRTAVVWNASGGAEVVCEGHTAAVFALAFTADGHLLTASHDWSVRLWDL